jgi:hypothetical protein
MMITKDKLKHYIDKFPDELSIDDLIEHLVFVEKLENRIKQSKEDDTISEEDLEKEIEQWFKYNG